MFREPAAPLSGGHWLTGTEPVRGIGSWLRAGFEPTDGGSEVEWLSGGDPRDWGVEPKIGGKPQKWMVCNGKPLSKWMIWGVPLFLETPIGWFDEKPSVCLVVEPTHLKRMLVKMGILSPRFGVNIKNIWNHHPASVFFIIIFVGSSFDHF